MKRNMSIAAAALILSLLFLFGACKAVPESKSTTAADAAAAELTEPAPQTEFYGVTIDAVAPYTGVFYEEGADVDVTNVLSLTVTNNSDRFLQYMLIEGEYGGQSVAFGISVLPPGSSCRVAERSQTAFRTEETLKATSCDTFLFFDEAPDAMTDTFGYRGAAGTVSVTNVTEDTLIGTLTICYKNVDENGLVGGIAYTATAEDVTLRAGMTVDVGCAHFDPATSRIMFTEFKENG